MNEVKRLYTLEVAHRKMKTMTAKATRTLTTSPMDKPANMILVLCISSSMMAQIENLCLVIYEIFFATTGRSL